MLALALPLLGLLEWAAGTFPNWDDQSTLVPFDDQFTLIIRDSSDNTRWSSHVTRYFLLANRTGRLHKVLPTHYDGGGLTSGSPFLKVMANGTIVRSLDLRQWQVDFARPLTMAIQSVSTEYGRPFPVGNRFVISPIMWEIDKIRWYDLTEPKLTEHVSTLPVYENQFHSIPNFDEPVFYNIYTPYEPAPGVSMAEMESSEGYTAPTDDPDVDNKTEPNETEDGEYVSQPPSNPVWDAELKSLQAGTPKPHPSFTYLAMLVLYRMTSEGPVEVSHWPVGIEKNYSPDVFIKADGPYIFCMSLDAKSIEVHDASTGEVRTRVPLQPTIVLPSSIDWPSHRYAIGLTNGTTFQAVDPSTGQALACDPNYGCIFSRQGDRYLELIPQVPNTPISLAFQNWPPRLQVRQYPSGKVLANYRMPDTNVTFSGRGVADYPRLSADGQQVILHTTDERILVLDALSGRITRVIQAERWPYYACIFIVALLVLWIVAWVRVADREHVPQLIKLLVITAIVVAFLTMRLQLSGHPGLRLRLAAIGILAIATAWSAELMQHLIRSGCSLRSRTIASTVYLVCMTLVIIFIVVRYDAAETILAGLYLNACFAAFYFLLRRTKRLTPYPNPQAERLTVRAIMVMTAFAAVAISVAYRQSWSQVAFPSVTGFLIILAVLTLIAALIVSVRHSFRLRYIAIPVCIVLALIAHAYRYDVGWCWHLSSYLACCAVAGSFKVCTARSESSTLDAASQIDGTRETVLGKMTSEEIN